LLREAQSQVDELQARMEAASAERVVEVELLVANAEQESRAERDRIRAEGMAEVDEVIARAKDEGRALLEQVQEARRRVLADLATRRRALSIQIEQLRAARDEMAASVSGVRDTVDTILVSLQRTDEEARAAALAAGDQARLHGTFDAPADEEPPPSAAAEPPPAAPTGEDGAADEDNSGGEAPSVDELFARIRAGSDEPEAGTAPVAVAPPAEPAGVPATGDQVKADLTSHDQHEDDQSSDVPDPVAIRRDELLSPITAQLSRHIKRALGDDQNRLLDALRHAPGRRGDELMGSEATHLDVFTSAARSGLEDAFSAGVLFAGKSQGSVPAAGSVDQTAAGLARTVVTMLRRRIEEGQDDVGELVGAAYREWRGERIERLVGDFAVQAFSSGTVAAAGETGKVRWVLTSDQGCSDCDDNALAGAVLGSEGFPTGHPFPPAHSGCRCLVTPS
jgi:hypothetical protein